MKKIILTCLFFLNTLSLIADNQTEALTAVLPPTNLPFEISIELMDLNLPNGWHSGAFATSGNKCLLIAGRTNGLHGFSDDPSVNNFPPSAQNTVIYVIDFKDHKTWQRPLTDPSSGLTQTQIDTLSATSPQFYQRDNTLFISGGYGIDTATGQMGTNSILSALDIKGLINWVVKPKKNNTAAKYIRQTSHPLLQVTGGYMGQTSPHEPTLLIFGQNFTGFYRDGSNGVYTNEVRAFRILDDGKNLRIAPSTQPPVQNPAYRRRDLNVVPIMRSGKHHPTEAFVALSGVFTLSGGIWTVPVMISPDGSSVMQDPLDPNSFKQAMNNYASANLGLFSAKTEDMFILIFGGMTLGFFDNGVFETDNEIPFTNEITTVKIDKDSQFTQYIMASQYPTILSTSSNPGNTLLFGAGAEFVPVNDLPIYQNGVVNLDKLANEPFVIGYIVGGIQSTLPNTNTRFDSAASPYIFQVLMKRKN